jgi:peptidoglycan/xylan/chitin deacetylase (PgdA/CDA1 family)
MRVLLLLAISYLYVLANAHIFLYHRFGDSRHTSTNTTLQELKKEFQYFNDNGYKVVKIEDIIKKINHKEKIPDNWIALTIDDSYKSFYSNALPIFRKYNFPFTLAVYVKASEKKYHDFMTWDEIKEVSKYGTIALHSYAHDHLTTLSPKDIYKDTQIAFKKYEKIMGYKPTIYVYPYGEYDEKVFNEIKKFNFVAILNQNAGSVNRLSNVLNINRIALVGDVNIKQKLKYTTLEATWIEPKEYPKDNLLKHVVAKVDPSIKSIKLYVTGDVWRDIKVKNGIIDETLNIKLKKDRVRVILGTDYHHIASHIIIK